MIRVLYLQCFHVSPPFQANNSVNKEPLANAKMKTWWHLINRLGAESASQMESVVVPFIRFCYGNPPSSSTSSATGEAAATPSKSSDEAKSPMTPSSPVKKYGSMPPLCLDAVAQGGNSIEFIWLELRFDIPY